VTHAPLTIARLENFISINSALQVDLFGQAYSEVGPMGLHSGPGGASDYARAARLTNGTRIVALNATALKGEVSRIVAPAAGTGPVSLGRMDIDLVITEFGIADLRDLSHDARACGLVAIAAPQHRETLRQSWRIYSARL
jgi:acyl-CoA hydrolase